MPAATPLQTSPDGLAAALVPPCDRRSAWAGDADAAWPAGPPSLLPSARNRSRSNPYKPGNLPNTSARLQQPGADHPAHLQCLCAAFCPHGPEHIHVVTIAARGSIRPSVPDIKGPGQRADVFQRCLSTVGSSRATYMTLWSAIPHESGWHAASWKLGTLLTCHKARMLVPPKIAGFAPGEGQYCAAHAAMLRSTRSLVAIRMGNTTTA